MRPRTPKHYFYFRLRDATDQALYRYLMRHQPAARTKLFRDFLLDGFRRHLRNQRTRKYRARKHSANGLAVQTHEPVSVSGTGEPMHEW